MNLNEIKVRLGVEVINLNQVVTESGERTSWYKHWDNTDRRAILIHTDTLAAIKADKAIATLGISSQIKQGAQGDYTADTICIYKPADVTL